MHPLYPWHYPITNSTKGLTLNSLHSTTPPQPRDREHRQRQQLLPRVAQAEACPEAWGAQPGMLTD